MLRLGMREILETGEHLYGSWALVRGNMTYYIYIYLNLSSTSGPYLTIHGSFLN